MSVGFVNQPQGVSLDALIIPAKQIKAGVHVVIDEAKAIPAFQALGAQVIYRQSRDDHAHERYDAAAFVADLHAQAPAGALLHLGNEPGRNNLGALDSWSLAAMQACDRVGRKGVIFNFETGNPEPDDWPALAASVQYAYEHGHIIGLHEYFNVTVARSLKWHVGRFKFLLDTFGAKTPRIIITELGCAVDYNAYAGWQTVHTAESYAPEIGAAMDVYRPYGIDALVYLLGYWDRTATFDCRGQQPIFDEMERVNHFDGVDDMVPGYKQAKTKQAGVNVNLRGGPGLGYAPVGVVRTGDWVKRLPGSTVAANGYTWAAIAVDKSADSHLHGWCALEVIWVGD